MKILYKEEFYSNITILNFTRFTIHIPAHDDGLIIIKINIYFIYLMKKTAAFDL